MGLIVLIYENFWFLSSVAKKKENVKGTCECMGVSGKKIPGDTFFQI